MIPEWAIEIAIGLYHRGADGRHSGDPTRDQIAEALVEAVNAEREACQNVLVSGELAEILHIAKGPAAVDKAFDYGVAQCRAAIRERADKGGPR